jgi:hypothetical protein
MLMSEACHGGPCAPCLTRGCDPQGFRNKDEVQRFADMMEEMCHIVATKHSGSLKGEHGTGGSRAVHDGECGS